jgi:hypothetical protein
MEKGRIVKTYHGDRELNDKIARIIGIKREDGMYESMSSHTGTVFTAPPEFDIRNQYKDILIGIARNRGFELQNKDNQKLLCEEFVEKLKDTKPYFNKNFK